MPEGGRRIRVGNENARGQNGRSVFGRLFTQSEIAAWLQILPEKLTDRDLKGVGQLYDCG
jgi:hypothetical protein